MKYLQRLKAGFPSSSADELFQYMKEKEIISEMASSDWPLNNSTDAGNASTSFNPAYEYLQQIYISLAIPQTNNLDRGSFNWLMLDLSGDCILTGMTNGTIGLRCYLTNTNVSPGHNSSYDINNPDTTVVNGGFNITVVHQATSSENRNLFFCSGEVNLILGPGETVVAIHDGNYWRVGGPCCSGEAEYDKWLQLTFTTAQEGTIDSGTQSITPASMIGIWPGVNLRVEDGGYNPVEIVTVISTTPTTNPTSFLATFTYNHNAPTTTFTGAITEVINTVSGFNYWPGVEYTFDGSDDLFTITTTNVWLKEPNNLKLGPQYNYRGMVAAEPAPDGVTVCVIFPDRQDHWVQLLFTFIDQTIDEGEATVTPVSMDGILIGMSLEIVSSQGTEIVGVTNITPTTFTAIYTLSHTSPISVFGAYTELTPGVSYWPGFYYNFYGDSKVLDYVGFTWFNDINDNDPTTFTYYRGIESFEEAPDGNLVHTVVISDSPSNEDRWVQIAYTTIPSGVSPGTQTITPASMEGILLYANLLITGNISEIVTVSSVTSTTFTATFTQEHPVGGTTVTGYPTTLINGITVEGEGYYPGTWYIFTGENDVFTIQTSNVWVGEPNKIPLIPNWLYRGMVPTDTAPDGITVVETWPDQRPPIWTKITSTTITLGVSAGTHFVTPVSMDGIWPGVRLQIYGGTDTTEIVTVIATSLTQFEAIFLHNHTAGTTNVLAVPTLLGPENVKHWAGSWYLWDEYADDVTDAPSFTWQGNTWIVDPNQNGINPNVYYLGIWSIELATDLHPVALIVNTSLYIGQPVYGGSPWNILALNGTGGLSQIPPGTTGSVLTSTGPNSAAVFQSLTNGNYWEFYKHTYTVSVWNSENEEYEGPPTSADPIVSKRRYYIAGVHVSNNQIDNLPEQYDVGNIIAVPFISPGGGILCRLAMTAQINGGTNATYVKMAIWTANGVQADGSWSNYPLTKVLEAESRLWSIVAPPGPLPSSALVEFQNDYLGNQIMLNLQPNVLYWLGFAMSDNTIEMSAIGTDFQASVDLFGSEYVATGWATGTTLIPTFCGVPYTWAAVTDPTPQFPNTFPVGAQLLASDFNMPVLGYSYYNSIDGP